MNRLICITLLLAGISTGQDRADIRDRFAGAWRLVRLEQPGPDGKIHDVDCTGLFVFTRDGHASVQVMDRNPQRVHDRRAPAVLARWLRSVVGHIQRGRTHSHVHLPYRGSVGAHPCGQRPAAFLSVFGKAAHRQIHPYR